MAARWYQHDVHRLQFIKQAGSHRHRDIAEMAYVDVANLDGKSDTALFQRLPLGQRRHYAPDRHAVVLVFAWGGEELRLAFDAFRVAVVWVGVAYGYHGCRTVINPQADRSRIWVRHHHHVRVVETKTRMSQPGYVHK